MTEVEIVNLLKSSGALLSGHFQLRSGLHSDHFFQAALLLQYPDKAETVCRHLAEKFRGVEISAVISPAVGGLIVGQEIARALGCRAIFADKEDGQLVLKRGFAIRPGEKILVAEDVVTKGGRVQQTIDLVRSFGGDPVAVGIITDRSGGTVDFGIPLFSLIKLNLPTYQPEECPLCKQGIPVVRPGSKS